MPRKSPPKHRHDGTSPLPLGMDWSPPPKKWGGRNTLWPHDPKTGWSYYVMIPSWLVQTGSGASSDSLWNPIVFYRIQVGVQSPQGISSGHGVLRRFSDFMKLISDLKRVFPKKYFPQSPPKHALLRINSNRQLIEERRRALEEWMGKLLSDIDLSRSAPVASFLELEAAARSSFQDAGQPSLETSISGASAEFSTIAWKSQSGTSGATQSIASGTSDSETLRYGSNGHVVVHELPDQAEGISSLQQIKYNSDADGCASSRNFSDEMILLRDKIDSASELDHEKLSIHSLMLSNDSIGSDTGSIKDSEFLIPRVTSLVWDESVDSSSCIEFPIAEALSNTESQSPNETQIFLPLDERHKITKLLNIMQHRQMVAQTDMEDLIARLNQEIMVKEFLARKVKNLEVDLNSTKQRSKENLQQAILLERERLTQTQWAMDELTQKYLELETKFKFEQIEKNHVKAEKTSAGMSEQELVTKQEQIEKLQRRLEELEKDSKTDIKVLVKEVKFLRNSLSELKEKLNQAANDNAELETTLLNVKKKGAHTNFARMNLIHKCETLRHRLQECKVNFIAEAEDRLTVSLSSFPAALDLLATSDNRIDLLIAELLAPDHEELVSDQVQSRTSESSRDVIAINGDDQSAGEEEMKRVLIGTLIDNARLRKQLNSAFRCALKTEMDEGDQVPSRTAKQDPGER
ncbi:PX domain-containing protein EREL1-like isoform X2 [Dendrobium catenatum]|uniref:PX domain-containing protein n=1 Tax=Dendrobium catenatum TaxID=906689 RepID=A0A2I0VKL8_9ASPA|nr:PX domain-containing protein EREL1-like isoform X2 [Dendrobium catenatum]PKU63952.1 hypothetical protein MA16_Dca021581 [Dendrobium catenatum]